MEHERAGGSPRWSGLRRRRHERLTVRRFQRLHRALQHRGEAIHVGSLGDVHGVEHETVGLSR